MAKNGKRDIFSNKFYLFFIISFFALSLFLGIRASYAYYHHEDSISIATKLVGDFDNGDGDINIVVYKQNTSGAYVKTYSVPAYGFVLDHTSCTKTCTTNASSDCYYNYDVNDKSITLTSNEKVTCKFYFNESGSSDINVYVLIENENGSYTRGSKHYSQVNNIPAYGYTYAAGTCDNNSTPTYNSETKNFSFTTTTSTTCYAYFDSVGSSDVTTTVYVQKEVNGTEYVAVDSIPANHTYAISTNHASTCTKTNGTSSTAPTYTNGYVVITSTEPVTCTVYLDLNE